MKKCIKCLEWKKRSEFYAQVATRDHLNSYCKSCSKANWRKFYHEGHQKENQARARKWERTHPEEFKKQKKAYFPKYYLEVTKSRESPRR